MVSFEPTGRWSCCAFGASGACPCCDESCAAARGEESKVKDAAATRIMNSRENRKIFSWNGFINSIVFICLPISFSSGAGLMVQPLPAYRTHCLDGSCAYLDASGKTLVRETGM